MNVSGAMAEEFRLLSPNGETLSPGVKTIV
jgi:hypothetical protein